MATIGLSKSSSVMPVARHRARAPAMFRPCVVVRERSSGMPKGYGRERASPQPDAVRTVPKGCSAGQTVGFGPITAPLTTDAPPARATGVVKRWGHTIALDGATLTVGHGVTGLLGANGAGKTTLLGMLLGLHEPEEGSVEVLGLDPTTAGPQVRARVGY